tara:strand:- start:375 stop:602 length:228 start_codon:yes stop_codon:yes gene_type:complete
MKNKIDNKDLLGIACDNVFKTEYSTKITIPVKNDVLLLFKDIKKQFNELGIKLNNAKLFELMVIEMYNSNKEQYQ